MRILHSWSLGLKTATNMYKTWKNRFRGLRSSLPYHMPQSRTDLTLEMVEVNEHYLCTYGCVSLQPLQVQMFDHWIIAYSDCTSVHVPDETVPDEAVRLKQL